MASNVLASVSQWVQRIHPKDDERNLFSATFHMITITLIAMSMVDVTWFSVSGGGCVPDLSLGKFFYFGYTTEHLPAAEYQCITPLIVSMIRITILLCFMAIIFTLGGFFLDIIGPKYVLYRILRRYAVLGICTILWILTIISLSYYVILLIEDSLEKNKVDASVTYGTGFFLLALAGAVCLVGIFYNLMLVHPSTAYPTRNDDRCLIDNMEDGLDTFNSPTPPPPYNVPPPPYSP